MVLPCLLADFSSAFSAPRQSPSVRASKPFSSCLKARCSCIRRAVSTGIRQSQTTSCTTNHNMKKAVASTSTLVSMVQSPKLIRTWPGSVLNIGASQPARSSSARISNNRKLRFIRRSLRSQAVLQTATVCGCPAIALTVSMVQKYQAFRAQY